MKRKLMKEIPHASGAARLKRLQEGDILTKQDIIAIALVTTQIEQIKALLRSIIKLQGDILERYLIDN